MDEYILNPSIDLQDSIQVRGLDPNARDPHSYLKMVAKTFSAFKEAPTKDGTISYIHGFSIDYLYIDKLQSQDFLSIDDRIKYLDVKKQYHAFRINPGACFIDDQYVEFNKPTIFLFDRPTDSRPITELADVTNPNFDGQLIKLYQDLKYKVIVEYKWIHEFPVQKARIKIIVDEPSYDAVNYPYLTLATFKTDKNGNVIKNQPEVFSNIAESTLNALVTQGELVKITEIDNSIEYYKRGIDPQYLSKKYIDNYKSLFQNIENELFNVFNKAGLGKSTFIVIEPDELELGLQSGTMVYFDQRDNLYKPAMSSRQKTDKVVGLYLHDTFNDTFLIFFGGLIDLDPDNRLIELDYKKLLITDVNGVQKINTFQNRYGLTYNHPLVNLEVGNYYFLEDDNNYFTDSLLMYNIDDYIEWDTRGFISTRQYPGAVKIGYAVDRTKILLNIDQSNETDWSNAVDLYGNHKLFTEEYMNVFNYYKYSNLIKTSSDQKTALNLLRSKYLLNLGSYADLTYIKNIATEDGEDIGPLKVIDYMTTTLPDYIDFNNWFLDNYILPIDISPSIDSNDISIPNLEPLAITEPLSNKYVVYFKSALCSNNPQFYNLVIDCTGSAKSLKSLYIKLLAINSNIIAILNKAVMELQNTLTLKQTALINNELDQLVLMTQLELGDDPLTVTEKIEDTQHNIIKDLGIKYTDENQKNISYDTLIEDDTATEINNRTIKKAEILNSLTIQKTEIDTLLSLINYYQTLSNEAQFRNNTILSKINRIETSISKLEKASTDLNATISTIAVNINSYSKLQLEAAKKRNSVNVLALDIFYLSNYERKRFNYTYLVDRLKYEFSLQATLVADRIVAQNKYSALNANAANEYEKKMAELEISRIDARITKNTENIKNYTSEINLLLKDFNRSLITLNDKSFYIEPDLINEDPKNFRFGVDYGPVGSNNERYLVNEAFQEVCRQSLTQFKLMEITRAQFPTRLIPAVYTTPGSNLTVDDFVVTNFKTLTFANAGPLIDTQYPFFTIKIDKVDTICYLYNGEYFKYMTETVLPDTLPELDFNRINADVSNANGDIITIDSNYYVWNNILQTFISLKSVDLSNEEITRFVREARVKSINEDFDGMVTYVGFINYFLAKEQIDIDINILNSYVDEINNIEITSYQTQVVVSLPTISSLYPDLITKLVDSYHSFASNLSHINELIQILTDTGNKTNLTADDISGETLITYGLTAAFRTSSITVRSSQLTKLMDLYRSMLYNDIDDIKFEINKFRDTNILNILSLNTEFNN